MGHQRSVDRWRQHRKSFPYFGAGTSLGHLVGRNGDPFGSCDYGNDRRKAGREAGLFSEINADRRDSPDRAIHRRPYPANAGGCHRARDRPGA
jgi:hypothetical protein